MTKEQKLEALQRAVLVLQDEISRIAAELDGDLVERCRKLKASGMFVEAIKQWRNERSSSLREAKDAVDAL